MHISVKVSGSGAEKLTVLQSYSKLIKSKWYTIAFTYADGILLLYVNGVLDTALDLTAYTIKKNIHSLVVGPGAKDYSNCSYAIKDFQIYNR